MLRGIENIALKEAQEENKPDGQPSPLTKSPARAILGKRPDGPSELDQQVVGSDTPQDTNIGGSDRGIRVSTAKGFRGSGSAPGNGPLFYVDLKLYRPKPPTPPTPPNPDDKHTKKNPNGRGNPTSYVRPGSSGSGYSSWGRSYS